MNEEAPPEAPSGLVPESIDDEPGKPHGLLGRLYELREEAIEYKENIGVREDWEMSQLHYDNQNAPSVLIDKGRAALHGGTGSPLEYSGDSSEGNLEVVEPMFIGFTRSYTDNAITRVTDLIIPANGRPWAISAMPVPALDSAAKNKLRPAIEGEIRADLLNQGAQIGDPNYEQAAQMEGEAVKEDASAIVEENQERARQAELKIAEWHVQGDFRAELIRCIQTAGKLGTGILCGPKVDQYRRAVYENGQLVRDRERIPVATSVLPWNCYPDPQCGQNIQDGSYHWERSWIQRRELLDMMDEVDEDGDPLFDKSAIQPALREGPLDIGDRFSEDSIRGGGPSSSERPDRAGNRFEIWYGYLDLPMDEYERHATKKGDAGEYREGDVVAAEVQILNDRIIRLSKALSVYGGDRFPYSYFRWSESHDPRDGRPLPWGRGIPSLISVPQRAINAAHQRAIDNLGIASSPMFEIDKNRIAPSSGELKIGPGEVFLVQDPVSGGTRETIGRPAIRPIEIPMHLGELISWIGMQGQFMEDLTGLTGLMGGAAGRNAPDTTGGMQLAANQADSAIRRVVRTLDKDVIAPIIKRFYEYYMIDETIPDSAKGNFEIKARLNGILERSLKMNMKMQLLPIAASNPKLGIDPEKLAMGLIEESGFDPESIAYTAEAMKVMQEQERAAAEQPPPQIAVAQIKAETEQMKIQMDAQTKQLAEQVKLMIEENREFRSQQERLLDQFKTQTSAVVEDEKIQSKERIAAEDRKVELAKASMDAQTKQRIEERKARAAVESAAAKEASEGSEDD